MSAPLERDAGSAVVWKGAQLAFQRGLALLRLLILARLLLPDDFGLLSIALVAVNTLVTLTDVGMIPALVQRREVDEAHYDAAWTVGVVRGLAISAAVVAAAPAIAALFGEPRAAGVIRVLAAKPLIDALASIQLARLTRELRFRSLAFAGSPAAVVEAVVAIALARHLGVWALVAGILAGAVTSVVLSYVFAPHRPRLVFDLSPARPLVRYGRWIFATQVLALAGSTVLQVVISRRLGAASLGIYYLAMKLAFFPSEVASEVVGAVAFPLYARLQDDARRAARAFQAIVTGLATALVPVYALFLALAPELAGTVLGERWAGTAPLLRILAVVGIVGLFGDAAVPLLKGLGRPYQVVALETVQSALMIALVGWLASRWGVAGAAFAWLPAVAASQALAVVFVRRTLGRPLGQLPRPAAAILLAGAFGGALAAALARLLPGLAGFAAAAAVGAAAVTVLLWAADRRLRLGLASDLGRAFPQLTRLLGIGGSS